MAVTITRKDRTAGELRAVAAQCKDAMSSTTVAHVVDIFDVRWRQTVGAAFAIGTSSR